MRRLTLAVAVLVLTVATTGALLQVTPTGDRTVTKVDLTEDGSATVTVVTTVALPNESERAAFESLQTEIEADDSRYLDRFRRAVTRLVSRANASTERRMVARDVSVSTRIEPLPQRRGVVEYSFRWTNVVAGDGDEIVVIDVLSGFVLGDDEALEVNAPPRWTVSSADPDPDRSQNGSVRWIGPRSFSEDEPMVVAEPGPTVGDGGAAGVDDGTDEAGEGEGVGGMAFDLLPWIVLFVLVGAVAAGLLLYRRRSEQTETVGLTDDERVIEMVEDAGGRLKQQQIEENTDWSAAKVSQVTSRLEEDDEIEKLRMGRENIIRFPGDDEI